jgi:hypothetical protein
MRINFLLLTVALFISPAAESQALRDAETWEREQAWRAAESVNTRPHLDRLNLLLKAGDDQSSLELIREIEAKTEWPAPARERLIFEFVTELRMETPRIIGAELIGHLTNYQSRVMVPHDDHPYSTVPMFNIRAAANGVVNHWSRQEAAFEGARLIASSAGDLIRAYQRETDFPRKRGLLDALDTATPVQLTAIKQTALPKISQQPELIEVALRAAINANDIDAIYELAERGDGPDMHRVFRDSTKMLDLQQNQNLLEAALRNESHQTASLAISQLSASLEGNPATEQLLIQLLDDSNLGSSAALALATSPSDQALQSLRLLADSDSDELFATRARLALQIHAAGFNAETGK